MSSRVHTIDHPIQLEYRGYEWATSQKRWRYWRLSRQQYFKYIRTLGLGRDIEKADRINRPSIPMTGDPPPNRIPNRAQKIARIRRDLKQGYSLSRAAARQGVPENTARSWMHDGAPPEHRASHDWWIEEAREYERYCVRSIDRALAGFELRRQQGLERDRRYSPRLTTTGNLPAMWVQPTEI